MQVYQPTDWEGAAHTMQACHFMHAGKEPHVAGVPEAGQQPL